MRRRPTSLLGALLALGLGIQGEAAQAQGPEAHEAEARAHFEKGVELLRDDALSDALAEFERSRALFPSAKATTNAAICLRRLGRFDEALDLVEALLVAFPDLPAEKLRAAQTERDEIARRVGTVVLEGGPAGAQVSIDGRDRGSLPAAARLRVSAGSRLVRLVAEGFQPFERRVDIVAQLGTSVTVTLNPLPPPSPGLPPPVVTEPPKEPAPPEERAHPWSVELEGRFLIARGFGGVSNTCTGSCVPSAALGGYGVARGGYQLPYGLSFGVTLGGLLVSQSLEGRAAALHLADGSDATATLQEKLTLRAATVGGWVGYETRGWVRARFHLGAGAMIGALGDVRAGTFRAPGGQSGTLEKIGQNPFLVVGLIEPQIGIGFQVSEHIELSASLEVPIFLPPTAVGWDAKQQVSASSDGPARFDAENFMSQVRFMVAPGLGARYAF